MSPLRCSGGGGFQLISRLVESSALLRMFMGGALGAKQINDNESDALRDRKGSQKCQA